MRVFKEDGVVLESNVTITGATQANPCVVTANSHGYSNGNEVFISGVGGMTRLNNRFFKVANVTTNTFELQDIEGNAINSSAFTAYTSGGTVARLYTLTTTYAEADLPNMVVAQQSDVMYICCAKTAGGTYKPRKLTRSGHAAWSLADVSLQDGPYYPENTSTTTLALSATSGSVTVTASTATFAATDVGRLIRWHDGTNFTWLTITAYTSATQVTATVQKTAAATTATIKWALGIFTDTLGWPKLVEFYENRIVYANTPTFPQTFWGSKAAEVSSDFDTFTPGTDDNSAYQYRIASGQANGIRFIKGSDQFLLAGTYGAEHRINGGSTDAAITPTSISVKAFSFFGVAETPPVVADNNVMYLQRNQRTIRSIIYDPLRDGNLSDDKTILAPHITKSGISHLAFQAGPPNILWGTRKDGILIGLTYEQRQQVLAWHRQLVADGLGMVEDVIVTPQTQGPDRVWVCVKLTTSGGVTKRFICYMPDPAEYPDRDDYIFTFPATTSPADIETARRTDDTLFYRDMFVAQKQAYHVDCGLTYDGSVQSVTMTPGTGATTQGTTNVTFTAGGSLFTASMVGREIWGVAGGRGTITAYTSATVVTCTIREAFPALTTLTAGNWYLTTDNVSGLDHLEGFTVKASIDGATTTTLTVTNGAVALPIQGSIIHVGLPYSGLLISNELGGQAADGSSDGRVKTVSEVAVYFRNSLGASIGTDPYRLDNILFRVTNDVVGRPTPLFSGWKTTSFSDEASPNKRIYIRQENPQPCIIQAIRATSDAKALAVR
jgi:hypothetical protein